MIQTWGGAEIISGQIGSLGAVVGGGLIRASSAAIYCDWEDGDSGNSERLYFTATDFMAPTASNARGAPTVAGIEWSMATGSPRPLVAAQTAAGVGVVPIIWGASKLMPVGFRLKGTDDQPGHVNILTFGRLLTIRDAASWTSMHFPWGRTG